LRHVRISPKEVICKDGWCLEVAKGIAKPFAHRIWKQKAIALRNRLQEETVNQKVEVENAPIHIFDRVIRAVFILSVRIRQRKRKHAEQEKQRDDSDATHPNRCNR